MDRMIKFILFCCSVLFALFTPVVVLVFVISIIDALF